MSVRVCVCVCVCVCVKSAQQHDTDRLLMVRTVTSPGYRSCTSDRRPSHLKERRTAGTGTGTKANNGAVQDSNTTEGHDHIAEVTVAAHARKRGGHGGCTRAQEGGSSTWMAGERDTAVQSYSFQCNQEKNPLWFVWYTTASFPVLMCVSFQIWLGSAVQLHSTTAGVSTATAAATPEAEAPPRARVAKASTMPAASSSCRTLMPTGVQVVVLRKKASGTYASS